MSDKARMIRMRQQPPPRCNQHGYMLNNGNNGAVIYYRCPVCGTTGKQPVAVAYEYFPRRSK